jgi:hypothetical protein
MQFNIWNIIKKWEEKKIQIEYKKIYVCIKSDLEIQICFPNFSINVKICLWRFKKEKIPTFEYYDYSFNFRYIFSFLIHEIWIEMN